MKTLPTWARKSKFKYSGSVKKGTSISYGTNFRYSAKLSAAQYEQLLSQFRGSTVDIGTSRDNPPRGSLGEWLQSHITRTALASYIGPILIEEGCAERAGKTLIRFYNCKTLPLLLKFKIDPESIRFPSSARHNSPVFHRWLPDGEKDAIDLEVKNHRATLKVWFERYGYQDGSHIKFNTRRREVDPDIMSRQGCLEAGPLMGVLEIGGLPQEMLTAVQKGETADGNYRELAKLIVKQFIFPNVSEFIDTIRANYGQYWMPELEGWDSRGYSLGYYCSHTLGLQWSLDKGKTWNVFDPDEPRTVKAKFVTKPGPNFDEYLSEGDWKNIVGQTKTIPRIVRTFLARSHQFFDEGELRYAFIEGVTALELAINDVMRKGMATKSIRISGEAFWNLPLRTQLTVIAVILGSLPSDQLELALKALEYRHLIVHDGWSPPEDSKTELYGLLRTIASLYPRAKLKFASIWTSKTSAPPEFWEKKKPSER